MISTANETEHKYDVAADTALPPLEDVPGVAAQTGRDRHTLQATYYDTTDLRLARSGVTVRRRSDGSDSGWHVKIPSGADSRTEIWLEDSPGQADQVPAELASLVTVYRRDADLAPVAEITTDRRTSELIGNAGRPLAEVADDRVTSHRLGADSRSADDRWREVEVELTEDGPAGLLDDVQRRLAAGGIQRSASSSKLARALGDRLPDPRHPDRQASAGNVVLDYLRGQLDKLRSWDVGVRRDAPDAVHQMRVASRRIRSALQAFGRLIDRERTKELTDELRWLARVLGDARDLEVLRERYSEQLQALPDELVIGPVSARLTRYFARAEAAARADVLDALSSPRYVRVLDQLQGLLDDPPVTERAGRAAKQELPRAVRRAYRRLARRMEHAEQASGPGRDAALHEARKAAKRLRYALEAVRPTVGAPARRTGKRVKRLQQVLGEHQDAVVARPVLRELGMQAHGDGENAFTFGALVGTNRARAADADAQVPGRWRTAASPKLRRWLH